MWPRLGTGCVPTFASYKPPGRACQAMLRRPPVRLVKRFHRRARRAFEESYQKTETP